MDARRIDLDAWPRREHFAHYRERVPCTHATTVELDVTAFAATLAASSRKTYVAQIWAIATVVQRHEALRMTLVDGEPALWDVVHPAFTVLRPATEAFACVWAPYDADFAAFHAAAASVLAEHRTTEGLFPMGPPPANAFDVSSLPWTSFTGFSLQVRDAWDHLAPIVTLGRYVERGARTMLPLSLQIHHAAADGVHVARALEDLQALLAEPEWAR
ncbi:CatA-like O-acetyltransferase [Agrococcus sp. SGAir0287]|uniref:CatA-like O-acetyltransferase n=1 Tax=Agrococcus sp. SGAir0287 TaxID=2070347 RepID=UPI0010CD27CB|nr:CatA-like O-acetyltransferase [Agrococcus sp. SGAir0287]QCR18974.1 chloramphenicol acetyltransferase CAT [Agrococcus sp. SGAir0287]